MNVTQLIAELRTIEEAHPGCEVFVAVGPAVEIHIASARLASKADHGRVIDRVLLELGAAESVSAL